MNDIQYGGLSPGRFALLAALEPLVFALGPLLLSPWLLARTYRKVYGAKAVKRPKHWYVPKPLRRFLSRRPALRPAEDPFFWQEKGAATVGLRAVAWAVPAVIFIPILGVWAFLPESVWRSFRADRSVCLEWFASHELHFTVACVIAGVMSLAALFYAANVFAREKGRKTLDAFMMLVRDPRRLYRAKLMAVFWALKWCYPVIAGLLVLTAILEPEDFGLTGWPMVICVAVAVLGPPGAATIGMVFSAAAKTSGGAVAGIVLSPFAYQAMGIVTSIPLLFTALIGGLMGGRGGVFAVWGLLAAVAIVFAYRLRWRWPVWKLTFLLALWMQLLGTLSTLVVLLAVEGTVFGGFVIFVGSCILWVLCGYFWYRFGARVFEACMLGERVREYPG